MKIQVKNLKNSKKKKNLVNWMKKYLMMKAVPFIWSFQMESLHLSKRIWWLMICGCLLKGLLWPIKGSMRYMIWCSRKVAGIIMPNKLRWRYRSLESQKIWSYRQWSINMHSRASICKDIKHWLKILSNSESLRTLMSTVFWISPTLNQNSRSLKNVTQKWLRLLGLKFVLLLSLTLIKR